MKAFRMPMEQLDAFVRIREAMKHPSGVIMVSGCVDSEKPQLIDSLSPRFPAKVIVAPNDLRARELYEEYRVFDRDVMLFPAKDLIFFQADVRSSHLEQQRISLLRTLAEGRHASVIMTVNALMNRMMPMEAWKDQIRRIRVGDTLDLEEWKKNLVRLGYERCAQTDGPGQFAVRGGILDIFPLTEEMPVRIELWGDEVDSIRCFDDQTQRSSENMEEVMIYPATELILTDENFETGLERIRREGQKTENLFRARMRSEEAYRIAQLTEECEEALTQSNELSRIESFLTCFWPKTQSILSWFPEETPIFLDEPNHLIEAAQAAETEFTDSMQQRLEKGYALPCQADLLLSVNHVTSVLSETRCVGLSMLEVSRGGWKIRDSFYISVQGINSYNGSFEMLIKDLARWKKEKYRVILLSGSRTRGERLARDLGREGLNAYYTEDPDHELKESEILVTSGYAKRGYEYPDIHFAVVTESDIFGKTIRRKRQRQRAYSGEKLNSLLDLSPGDYVVHESNGLGIFRGIEQIETDHVRKDYIKIEYQDNVMLYVWTSNLDVIQKYADADAKKPRISKLGGQEWHRTRTRVKGAVREIARELIELYASRSQQQGFACGPDTVWQQEFEETFPYEETEDQLQAIEETKQDMMSTKIMDRLICGDVGYGKTEIALRAAFKAVQEGKQVAYLVPTTILAQQHYHTFTQRMKDYPIRVDLLCRMRSAAEQKKTIHDLAGGQVDIVIGTHRILSKDVAFRDLGLLVIDEEQRFGVTHKEKIKQIRKDVDVLTLTATPIPRTLHMSLIGIRDMSLLEEAPQDRLPIQTFVMEYNEQLVREAINREIARGGQVYYVYNKVNSIMEMTDRVAALVPDAAVAFAHGQMRERELERIMTDFINGEIDVLVTTTIIETGLDIPNANTMIVHSAETFGLSQLYQLRGRIGRSNRTSYAYLMYKRDKVLRETAEKRLSAIREFTELGSGIRIAMRDLEIRGAGNLLGSEQHGHMEAVGYDLYCKLLGEAVSELKGEKTEEEPFETSVDLTVDAYIPDYYIRSEEQKLDIYKRIALIRSEEDYDDMADELMDRYGELPQVVHNLLSISLCRAMAHRVWLTEVRQKEKEIEFICYERAKLNVSLLNDFVRSYKGKMGFRSQPQPAFRYFLERRPGRPFLRDGELLHLVREVLQDMTSLLE